MSISTLHKGDDDDDDDDNNNNNNNYYYKEKGGSLPTSHHRGLGSIPAQRVWDLWWTKCH